MCWYSKKRYLVRSALRLNARAVIIFVVFKQFPLFSKRTCFSNVRDDTNLSFDDSNINILLITVNDELLKINRWFSAKMSLNVGKTKFSLLHKSSKKHNTPSFLPTLNIDNQDIERVSPMKFLGVLLNDNLSWNKHVKYI